MSDVQRVPVSAELIERVTAARALVRSSFTAWEAFVATLTPGTEMDVVACLSVSGPSILRRPPPANGHSVRPVSTDLTAALWLCDLAEVSWEIGFNNQIWLTDPADEVRATVTSRSMDGESYEGEGYHRPTEGFRNPDDVQRAIDDGDDAEDTYHACGSPRCIAEALTRALLMMYSPTDEELCGSG